MCRSCDCGALDENSLQMLIDFRVWSSVGRTVVGKIRISVRGRIISDCLCVSSYQPDPSFVFLLSVSFDSDSW